MGRILRQRENVWGTLPGLAAVHNVWLSQVNKLDTEKMEEDDSLCWGYLSLITFFILEIGVRLWGHSEPHIYDPIYRPFEQSEDIPYVHKPNLVQAHARGLAIINTDSLGLRGRLLA